MACINMFNSDHQGRMCAPPPMNSPRISFSNDFVVQPPPVACKPSSPADPNFEFSAVGNRPMIAADELFFKGRLLPLKEGNQCSVGRTTTLRDELLADEDDGEDEQQRSSKGTIKWKGFLGLKKSHCSSTKRNCDKNEVAIDAVDADLVSKSMQEI